MNGIKTQHASSSELNGIKGNHKRRLTVKEKLRYASFEEILPSNRRAKVSDKAHEWMENEFRIWREMNGLEQTDELPYGNIWYWEKRIDGIQSGYLTKAHSRDVVRSWLKHIQQRQTTEYTSDNACVN